MDADEKPAPEAGTAGGDHPHGPLLGLKVLDIATVVAAPMAACLLGDFGADVLKVEIPGAGDHVRQLPPHRDGVSLWSKVVNRNKRGITLDIRTAEGRDVLERLIARHDILVENFRPGTLDRWGLPAARLFEINPHLIILRVTGFGQTGPYRNRPGFARIFEAMSGFVSICGHADGPPMNAGYPVSDAFTGLFGAYAVVSAVHAREATPGRPGQEIDLAASEAMLRVLDFLAIEYDQLGVVRGRSGNLNAYSAPSDVYRTSDEVWITLAVSAPPVFARFAVAMGRPELVQDARFATNVARLKHRDAIEQIVRDWFSERDAAEVEQILRMNDVSFHRINTIKDVFEDPHFAERRAIVTVPDGDFGSVRMQGVVPQFSRTPGRVWRTGPSIGEHNAQVLGEELELSEETLAGLRDRGVI
jgi:crotonobetainyl-CoA:carnitine CoA-transferase CaiB-like acyl-CoA transferase